MSLDAKSFRQLADAAHLNTILSAACTQAKLGHTDLIIATCVDGNLKNTFSKNEIPRKELENLGFTIKEHSEGGQVIRVTMHW